MVILFTGIETLDNVLKQELDKEKIDSRIAFYEDYPLNEEKCDMVVVSPHIDIKLPLKDYLFALRQRDRRVILLLDNDKSEHLGYALALGIYDIVFDPITPDKIINRVKNPAKFSDIQGLYLGLKGKVSFAGEEITKPDEEPVVKVESEHKIKSEIKSEIKPIIEPKKEPEIVKNVIEIDVNKQNMAIDQIEGIMKLLGYKLKEKKDVNGALLELEQVLIEEVV
ncbi:hypothetical protein [Thermoanaerobacterium thermosaccharolyticum]|uniref:hypothetical protein n=1 Tax=Thermoanaerobacterium thermosaccharolyticum TaxID=1517 RepID=UPI00177BA777|nr:hypothetical protein [Thermoanaerobacterium thermosaccharolyticum]MBE0069841.1 hypothetical protein [Thermoanaerobacterium thermosaccharolyticum]MBE0227494.1 hypothetical protein [Thermoanaerobacterium thermosaccharolyticum]